MKATQYERRTYDGRVIESQQDSASCGTVDLRGHMGQMRTPQSWVHSSAERWLRIAYRHNERIPMSEADLYGQA